jgi:hypothetical protein
MRELIAAIDSQKLKTLVWCMVFAVMAAIITTEIFVSWIFFNTPPTLYLICLWALVLVGMATFFLLTLSTCCVRTESEIEWAARDKRTLRNLRSQHGLAEDERLSPAQRK